MLERKPRELIGFAKSEKVNTFSTPQICAMVKVINDIKRDEVDEIRR